MGSEMCIRDRVMVMPEEWSNGNVKVKHLSTGEESEVPFEEL